MFKSVTNSYKFLYFQSILNLLKKEGFPRREVALSLRDLAIGMATLAWYPKSYFHLDFGPQDQLGKALEQVAPETANSIANGKMQRHVRLEICRRYDALGLDKVLLRYVPYALLKCFFEKETYRLEGLRYEHEIRKLSQDVQRAGVPLYRFRAGNNETIFIQEEWSQYLETHLTIIEGWANFEWAKFLQRRNPNIPAIIEKLEPPKVRQSLSLHTAFWNKIIDQHQIICIYSKKPITRGDFDLDHFLPWSFVVHDEPWNLIPVHKSANRSKGNRLPAERYIPNFIDVQRLALQQSCQLMPDRSWKRATESYVSALRIDYPKLIEEEALESAYIRLIEPLFAIAQQSGFAVNWEFS